MEEYPSIPAIITVTYRTQVRSVTETIMRGNFIAYYRVSTDKQGKSGLGLDAQRKAVIDYLDGGKWTLVDAFTEIESGKRNDRPELEKALAACKKHKAKLVIAKLDRLSRNLAFIAMLMDRKVDFVCCDMPSATKFTIHILAPRPRSLPPRPTVRNLATISALPRPSSAPLPRVPKRCGPP